MFSFFDFRMRLKDIQMKFSVPKLWVQRSFTSPLEVMVVSEGTIRSHICSFTIVLTQKKAVFDRNFAYQVWHVAEFFFLTFDSKKRCWTHMNNQHIFLEWLQMLEKTTWPLSKLYAMTWSMFHHWCIHISCNWLFGCPFRTLRMDVCPSGITTVPHFCKGIQYGGGQ